MRLTTEYAASPGRNDAPTSASHSKARETNDVRMYGFDP
jgi:hypothetical protein